MASLRAQLGYFQGESEGLKLAETRVRSVLGEGLEPSRGKPSQNFKSCACLPMDDLSIRGGEFGLLLLFELPLTAPGRHQSLNNTLCPFLVFY